jgi:hypothetical protein
MTRGPVPERGLVPPGSRALGVPARVREGAGTTEFVSGALALYVENARRYRQDLVRLDRR